MATVLPDLPNCPKCGVPMAPGFLAFLGRMNWVDRIGLLDASVFKGDTIAGTLDTFGATGHFKGWRCARCQAITLDVAAGVL